MNSLLQNIQKSADIFLFPHQDDEFGVFHLLEENSRLSRRSICLFLTGEKLNKSSKSRRNNESNFVLNLCGVAQEDIYFLGSELGISDGKLVDGLEILFFQIQEIMQRNYISCIYVPAWEGGHPDHDAAVLLGRALIEDAKPRSINLLQFSLYNAYKTRLIPFRVLFPLPENGPCLSFSVSRKERISHLRRCMMYPSQTKSWVVLLPAVALSYQLCPAQKLQIVCDYRLQQRPHTGLLLYERRGWTSWEEQMSKSKKFREVHNILK